MAKWQNFAVLQAVLVAALFYAPAAYADSSGPNFPSTVVNDASVGTSAWASPGNASAADGVSATNAASGHAFTNYLKATNFNFNIPPGTVDGILLEINKKVDTTNNTEDTTVKLLKAGSIVGNNKANAATWPTALTISNYPATNATTDLWGTSWTYTDINNANFGAVLEADESTSGGSRNFSVDYMRITVYHHLRNPPSITLDNVYVSSMTAHWGLIAEATGYTLIASTNSTNPPTAIWASSTTVGVGVTTATVSGLNPNTTNFLFVQSNSSTRSSTFTALSGTSTLANAVSNTQIYQVFSTSVTVNWPALPVSPSSSTAEGYKVDASTASDFTGTLFSSSTTNVSLSTLTVSGLAAATNYFFRVGTLNWQSVANYVSAGSTTTNSGGTVLAVSFGTPSYNFGSVSMGVTTVSTSAITVTNAGNVTETYALSVATTGAKTVWSVGTATPTSNDKFVVFGTFNATQPASGSFGNEDIITGTPTTASSTVYSVGGQTGVSTSPSSAVNLWYRFDMPLSTSTTDQQQMNVTISASTP